MKPAQIQMSRLEPYKFEKGQEWEIELTGTKYTYRGIVYDVDTDRRALLIFIKNGEAECEHFLESGACESNNYLSIKGLWREKVKFEVCAVLKSDVFNGRRHLVIDSEELSHVDVLGWSGKTGTLTFEEE
jgi:hypothetical protein